MTGRHPPPPRAAIDNYVDCASAFVDKAPRNVLVEDFKEPRHDGTPERRQQARARRRLSELPSSKTCAVVASMAKLARSPILISRHARFPAVIVVTLLRPSPCGGSGADTQ